MAIGTQSVQSGQVTIDATSKTETLGTTLNDISDAILIFTVSADESFPQPQHSTIRGEITNTTTLTFDVVDVDSSSRVVEYQVIEFTAGHVDVQRGATTPSPVPTDITLGTTLGSLDDAWEMHLGADIAGTGYNSDDFFELFLTSTSNLRIDGHTGNSGTDVSWQVLEFLSASEFSAQRGAIATDTAATTEFTDTLGNAVTVDKAIVAINGWKINGAANPNAGAYLGKLNSTTEVAVQKDTADTTDAEARYLVGDFANVETQTGLISFIATDAQETATLGTAVSSDRLVFGTGWAQWGQGVGKSAYSSNDLYGEAMARFKFNTDSQIQADRGETNEATDIQWYVMDFSPSGGGGGGLSPISVHHYRQTIIHAQ